MYASRASGCAVERAVEQGNWMQVQCECHSGSDMHASWAFMEKWFGWKDWHLGPSCTTSRTKRRVKEMREKMKMRIESSSSHVRPNHDVKLSVEKGVWTCFMLVNDIIKWKSSRARVLCPAYWPSRDDFWTHNSQGWKDIICLLYYT